MGNKDWSHLRNEHQSRFSKGQPKEAPLEKGSPEKLEDTLAKEPEVVEVPAFQEEVKQEEERKDEPAIGVKEESYVPKEGSFATPEDESAQVVLATPLTEEARSETPAQDTIGQSPSAEKKVEHQGGSRLISETDMASLGGGRHSEPRQTVLDSQSDRAKTYSPSSNSGGSSLAAFFGLLAMLGLFAYLASGGIHSEEHPSSTTSEYGSPGRSYGTRKETLKSGIAPEGEFQFQVTYEKAISLIPGLSEGDQGRTSSTYLSPQNVVAVLGKASSGEETYQEGGVSPFMTSLDYEAEGSPSSVTVLLSNMIGSRLSSLNFENLNSERLANKNGSLNREDFANIKIGTSYSDLVNTVGIPSRVSWSSMMSSEYFLIFYYKLSDSRSVIIRFGSNRTISEIKGLEDPTTSTSP